MKYKVKYKKISPVTILVKTEFENKKKHFY